ncbi:MAG: DNA replication and repair protein RecF [Ilumatobacteraceae bacterium]
MIVETLELVDFRNYAAARFELADGMTVVMGDNGHGKTNLAEALAYLATLSSFRAMNNEVMIREGADRAVVRAVVRQPDERRESIDAELPRRGVGRVFVNRQRLRRVRDLLGTVRVTVFSPDDLVIVKGSPGGRRRYLDETLSTLSRKHDAARLDIDRLLRQRNTLLKQLGSRWAPSSQVGSRGGDDDATLDIWDQRFADAGDRFGATRAALVEQLRRSSARRTASWPVTRRCACPTTRPGGAPVSPPPLPQPVTTTSGCARRRSVHTETTSSCS